MNYLVSIMLALSIWFPTNIDLKHAKRNNSTRRNLSLKVNSMYDEVNPVFSADGNTLYFARKNCPRNVGGKYDPQDIWKTNIANEGWAQSVNPGQPFNTLTADNLLWVSKNQDTLCFYTNIGRERGKFIYRVKRGDGWSERIPVGLEIVNESKFLEGWMSTDGKTLLFTARTADNIMYAKGNDERDIYVSTKSSSGRWARPVNMGKTINTSDDEYSPFLAADQRTLYFASRGRGGYGNADIFMSKRMSSEWTEWSEPVNLGSQINSSSFDAYFRVSHDGTKAYLVSHELTFGKGDIFEVSLPKEFRPEVTNPTPSTVPVILFYQAESALTQQAVSDLDKMIASLKKSETYTIEVHGFTDNQGTNEALIRLAKRRCEAVKTYLIKHGINRNQIEITAHGCAHPVASNKEEQTRTLNRRVEIKLINR